MDLNFNVQGNLNNSGSFHAMAQDQQQTAGNGMWVGPYPSLQQLQVQQLNASVGNVHLNNADVGTNYLDAMLTQQASMNNQYYATAVQQMSPNALQTASRLSQTLPSSNRTSVSSLPDGLFLQTYSPTIVPPSTLPLSPTGHYVPNTLGSPLGSPLQMQPNGPLSPSVNMPALIGPLSNDVLLANALAQSVSLNNSLRLSSGSWDNNYTPSVPNSLPLHNMAAPNYAMYNQSPASQSPINLSRSTSGSSTPQIPSSPASRAYRSPPETPDSQRMKLTMPQSDASSTASSTSVPSSPIGNHTAYSDGGSSPRSLHSPDNRYSNYESNLKSPTSPIESKSLLITVKYPQDKCYRCMKKVYPMEKIGPVKGVNYHKGCFQCHVCGSKLNLKNFYHNHNVAANHKYDVNVYCKSHQPESSGKGGAMDASAVLIRGAMSVPKLNKVNEQIRGDDETVGKGGKLDTRAFEINAALAAPKQNLQNVHLRSKENRTHHFDNQSLEMAHAKNIPRVNLAQGNKLRQSAWRKEERDVEHYPPADVVRHSDPVAEYDLQSLERLTVENFPDYER
jgi:hypothetical protein